MVNKLYVIYDSVAEESGPVYEAKSDAVALRGYQAVIRNSGNQGEDFSLLCIGEFDHEKVELTVEELPRVVVTTMSTGTQEEEEQG